MKWNLIYTKAGFDNWNDKKFKNQKKGLKGKRKKEPDIGPETIIIK